MTNAKLPPTSLPIRVMLREHRTSTSQPCLSQFSEAYRVLSDTTSADPPSNREFLRDLWQTTKCNAWTVTDSWHTSCWSSDMYRSFNRPVEIVTTHVWTRTYRYLRWGPHKTHGCSDDLTSWHQLFFLRGQCSHRATLGPLTPLYEVPFCLHFPFPR